jgi:flavin-dependent dehydrogenase
MGKTMTLPERETWDAVVVGAGVAGSYVAAHLAHAGAGVLLVERDTFPRDKVCGCCLNDRALGALGDSPIPEIRSILHEVRPLEGIRLGAGGRSAFCRFPSGGVISRARLDTALAEAARCCGAHLLLGMQARWVREENDGVVLRLEGQGCERVIRARLVVAADGLGSELLSSATGEVSRVREGSLIGAGVVLPADCSEAFVPGVIHMAVGQGGYLGLARLEDGRLDLAMACDATVVRANGGLGPLAGKLLSEAGWPKPAGILEARWRGTPRLTRRPQIRQTNRVVAVGDARGYIEPFTGEGMGWALEGARELLPGLKTMALGGNASWPRRQGIVFQGLACKALAAFLRRPGLVALAVRLLKVAPFLAKPFAWCTGRGKTWVMAPQENGKAPTSAGEGG